MNGLEGTQIYFSASSGVVCCEYLVDGLERSWQSLVFALFSMAEMDLDTYLHNTQMRPNLTVTGCPIMISFGVFWSMT